MAFVLPDQILREFSLDEGMHVADFGSGSGAYTISASKRVGSSGRIYAIDVNKEMLEKVKRGGAKEGRFNIEIVWGDVDDKNGTKLAPSSMDRVILSNVLFQSEDKGGMVKESCRILKPNGMVLVIDWSSSHGGLGPKEDHVILPADTRRLFLNNGFAEVREVSAGDYHYGIIFRKL